MEASESYRENAMQYMKLNPEQRTEFMNALAAMPEFLSGVFGRLSSEQTRSPGADGTPSPVEQVWHLADLEREGYAERIQRILTEDDPYLPDFDGTQVAAERNYRARSLAEGLAAFTTARKHNMSVLRSIDSGSWFRTGTQEGVGHVALCDIPGMMSQHDSAHRVEIEAWTKSLLQ
jgi:hypothetical protein